MKRIMDRRRMICGANLSQRDLAQLLCSHKYVARNVCFASYELPMKDKSRVEGFKVVSGEEYPESIVWQHCWEEQNLCRYSGGGCNSGLAYAMPASGQRNGLIPRKKWTRIKHQCSKLKLISDFIVCLLLPIHVGFNNSLEPQFATSLNVKGMALHMPTKKTTLSSPCRTQLRSVYNYYN